MTGTTTPTRIARAGVVLSVLFSGLAVGLLVAGPAGGQPGIASAAVAIGAAGLALAAVAALELAVRSILAQADRVIRIGRRDRRHPESLDRMAEPAHPATAGRPRPRAPGALAAA